MQTPISDSRFNLNSNGASLSNASLNGNESTDSVVYNCATANHTPTFPLEVMADALYGREFSRMERQQVYKLFDQPELLSKQLYSLDKFEARKFVEKQARIVLQDPMMAMYRIKQEPIKIVHRITMSGMLNTSLGTKMGVQSGLFGGSVLNLGGERHAHLLAPISKLELAGCFCMTELLHGMVFCCCCCYSGHVPMSVSLRSFVCWLRNLNYE